MENKFIINKCDGLKGEVKISGSKNSVLPIMAATLLTDEECSIKDVPPLSDVYVMEKILNICGSVTTYNDEQNILNVKSKKVENIGLESEVISRIRASFLVMGPLLAKNKYVKIPLPGGCTIGSRPVDLHLKGFAALGAEINNEQGFVVAQAKKLVGAKIYLDFPSVGATENIIMAATLAEGTTVIENSAVEPEIVDLANFINEMGGNVKGAGTDTIKIVGVEKLQGAEHTIIPDRIEAGTFMIAGAITRGDITITNVISEHLKPIIAKLREMNFIVDEDENKNSIRIHCNQKEEIKSIDIKTLPYPGFPTDLQSQFMTLLTNVNGTGVVTETVFENRFMQVGELKRMGANIKIDSRSAVVEGGNLLNGASVKATDLRAGASLILAGLVAEGQTEVSDIHHIERGYFKIEEKLNRLGAKINKKSC